MPTIETASGRKAPRPSRTRTPPRAVDIKVRVDRALKARWQEQIARLLEAKRQGAGAFDELWEAVGEIVDHDPPLYLAGGFSTARQFLAKYVAEDERTARRFVRVALYASPVEEARYGVSKLDATLTLLDAKNGGPPKRRIPVDFEKLRIPVQRDGQTSTLPLLDATVDEVRAATRKLLREAGRPHPKASPVVLALAKTLRTGRLKSIGIHFARGKITLSGIPLDALDELLRALARVHLPRGARA